MEIRFRRSWVSYLFLIVGAALIFASCGGDDDTAGLVPLSGTIAINGAAPQPFVASSVTVAFSGTNATLTFVNTEAQQNNTNTVRTVVVVVPINQLNTSLALDSRTILTETTTAGSGGTISTEFTTRTTSSGTAFLTSLSPNSAVGSFSATFTDATGKTRVINNASFYYQA